MDAAPIRIIVVVPTFNEWDNLPVLLDRLADLDLPDLHVVVVDDDSPDGTGELADKLAAEPGRRITVVHRTRRQGLGRAYVTGMTTALGLGADVVVQMDADLSHPVEAIARMLAALRADDRVGVVIGSRYAPGGSAAADWPARRRLLSRGANVYVNTLLRLGVRDATAGFKAWRAATLRTIRYDTVASNGYSFQVELTYRTRRAGLSIVEVPIHFTDRQAGSSKMRLSTQVESALMPWRLLLDQRRTDRRRETR